MLKPFPGLIGGSYPASSYRASVERTVNLFPETIASKTAPFRSCLLPTWGFRPFCTLPQSPASGGYTWNGRLWAIGGNQLYEVDAKGIATARGAVTASGTTRPTFTTNGDLGNQLMVTSGNDGFSLDLNTNVLSKVLTGSATTCAFLDDRFLALNAASNEIQVSALLNGTSWPALGVSARSVAADPWQAMLVSHRQIWLIGQTTGEVWVDTATDPDQPFALDPSGVLQYGIAAPSTLVEHDNAPTWIGATKDGPAIVLRWEGYQPQRLSNHALEGAMQGYSTIADAYAVTEQWAGHTFYTLVFPTAQACWSYDAATGDWHERGFWHPESNMYLAYRAAFHVFAFGKHLVGDRLSGGLYELTPDVATDMDGSGIRRLRRTAHLNAGELQTFIDQLVLDLDVGGAPLVGQGSRPVLMLRVSKDGGKTWGAERWITAGQLGAYGTRVLWNRLGMGRDWVFEIVITDPVVSAAKWVGAYLDTETVGAE